MRTGITRSLVFPPAGEPRKGAQSSLSAARRLESALQALIEAQEPR